MLFYKPLNYSKFPITRSFCYTEAAAANNSTSGAAEDGSSCNSFAEITKKYKMNCSVMVFALIAAYLILKLLYDDLGPNETSNELVKPVGIK